MISATPVGADPVEQRKPTQYCRVFFMRALKNYYTLS